MKNVLVIDNVDYSSTGLGAFTKLNLGTPVKGFLKSDGSLENTLSGWNERMRTSEFVNVPENSFAIIGITNEVRHGLNRTLIPALCFYDESQNFISSDNLISVHDEYIDTGIIEIYIGSLKTAVPENAKYFRICWCIYYNSAPADDVLIPATGPELFLRIKEI